MFTYFILEDMLIVEDSVTIGLRPRSVLFVQSFGGSGYNTYSTYGGRQAQNRRRNKCFKYASVRLHKEFSFQQNLSNTSAHQL
jgi:hypothetical protein